MPRLMYDSTAAADYPTDGDLNAGYTDGRFANMAALAQRFPGVPLVGISAVGTNSGIVGDCEPGCIWPQSSIVDWVLARRAAGVEPTVYCGAANLASVVAAFDQRGVARPVAFWTAHYTNSPHFCGSGCSYGAGLGVNVVATQYGGDLVGHYDVSTVADYWPGVDFGEHTEGSGQLIPDVQEDGFMAGLPLEQQQESYNRLKVIEAALGDVLAQQGLTPQQMQENYNRGKVVEAAVSSLLARPVSSGGAAVDVNALAAQLADALDDDLAKAVADVLAKRLAA